MVCEGRGEGGTRTSTRSRTAMYVRARGSGFPQQDRIQQRPHHKGTKADSIWAHKELDFSMIHEWKSSPMNLSKENHPLTE